MNNQLEASRIEKIAQETKEQSSPNQGMNRIISDFLFECPRCPQCNGLYVPHIREIVSYLQSRNADKRQIDYFCQQTCVCEAIGSFMNRFSSPKTIRL